MTTKAVKKYLDSYAEPETQNVIDLRGQWCHVVVIPSCNELNELLDMLRSLQIAADLRAGPVLAILVVNARENATDLVHRTNAQLIETLRDTVTEPRQISQTPPIFIGGLGPIDLLVLDRASRGFHFPAKQGVGLARKIGCDIALALFAAKKIQSTWIHCTDADVIVPTDYLIIENEAAGCAAITYPFDHISAQKDPIAEALFLYEISLRYYVLGLDYAGSPFTYHTIGSTLALDPQAYAEVRGFPRREAAEDFYLLNKLAKVGPIYRSSHSPINIRGRLSDRVPFGTGAGTRKIHNMYKHGEEFFMYDPVVFEVLKDQLHLLLKTCDGNDLQIRRTHTKFDAFRTLKLIHKTRDSSFPSLPWREALQKAPFCAHANLSTSDSATRVKKKLQQLEQQRLNGQTIGIGY
ncbi:MAG: hypothetical protein V1754_00665 [Pseudomonadota bacterium]